MMDSTFTDRVLAWNNVAIARLLDGNSSDCLEILRYALSQVQSALQAEAQSPQSLKRRSPCHSKLQGSEFQSLPLGSSSFAHCIQGNGTFSFFNRMVTMDHTAASTYNQLLCMLLFNLAVAHHQLGLNQGQTAELNTALSLYKVAFSVVETNSSDFLLGDQQMLLLGLYNNMGHIHSCFSQRTETQACVQWIQQVFLAFPQKTAPCLQDSDFQFFVQYMSVQACEQGNIASAA